VQEQKPTIARQRKDFEAAIALQRREFNAKVAELEVGVTARLEQQAAQIQKVGAQLAAASRSRDGLEANKFAAGRIRRGGPAPQVVNNP
jgi:hypothetical protein